MQVKQVKHDGLVYEMEVTIPANDIDARIDLRLKEVGKTIRMPGFRPGKVPMNLLKQKYGRAIMGEVLEQAVNETSAKAMQDKKLRPAMQPKIEVKEFDEGKDLKYAMTIEVLPEIKLSDFKGLTLDKYVAEASDKDVQDAMERLASHRTTTQPVETKRASKDGDTLVIDFHGRTADDNVEHEGMHSHGHHLKLGSGQFIPGFEDQLKGKKAGEKAEVKVSFPENYGAKELAGRDAIFDVEIHEIREDGETKIDDEFAKGFGMEKLDDLKKAIKDQLEQEFVGQARMVMKKHLLDYLDDAHDVDIPPTMLDMEHKNILDQLELERQRNPGQEELSDKEKGEFKDIAARRVRLGLILSEIGRQKNIQVSDIELQKAVIAEAQKYPGQEKQVFDYYAKNPQALDSMRAPLFEDKVVDYLTEQADMTEKKVSPEELMKILEAEEDEEPKAKKKPAAKKAASSSKAKASGEKAEKAEKEADDKPAAKKKAPAKKPAAKKS